MHLLGKRMLVSVPHQKDLYVQLGPKLTRTHDLLQRGCPTPKATAEQSHGYSAEARLAERTRTSLTQNQHCSPKLAAGHLLRLCLVKGSTPQATEKMHGVWTPTKLAGKSGALLLSPVKLKQLWKHLAEGCGCFQMERQLKAGLDWGICSFTETPSGTDGRGVLERMQFQYLTTYDCTNIKYQQ